MEITFLIGNGLDLSMGLKTRYCDFLKWYKEIDDHHLGLNESDSEHIAAFKNRIELKDSCLSCDDNKIFAADEWSFLEGKLGIDSLVYEDDVDGFLSDWSYLESRLAYYITEQESKAVYNERKEEITLSARHSLLEFWEEIGREDIRQQIQNRFSTQANSEHVVNFINFNYTHVLDRCIEIGIPENRINVSTRLCRIAMKINKPIHLHGEIGNDGHKIILGVDNEDQIRNLFFRENGSVCDLTIKSNRNTKWLGNLQYGKCKNYIAKSDILIVYGMSLGETDETWWRCIAARLHNDKNALLVIFFYQEKDLFTEYKRWGMEDSIKTKFLSYSGLDENQQAAIKNRIIISTKCNLFKLDNPLC